MSSRRPAPPGADPTAPVGWRRVGRAAVPALLLLGAALGPLPASATAATAPVGAGAVGAGAAPGPTDLDALLPDEALAAAQEELRRQAEALVAMEAEHGAAQAAAAAALERLNLTRRALDAATALAHDQAAALRRAERTTAEAAARLNRYAGALYRSGSPEFPLTLLSSLLDPDDPTHVLSGAAVAERAGANQSDALDALGRAEVRQAALAEEAAAAAAAQRVAAAKAADAEALAREVVAASARRVSEQAALHAASQGLAAVAAERAARLARAEAAVGERYRSFLDCAGRTVTGAGNGLLPVDALCPVWGSPGQVLRADAAAAYHRLALAYAERFGVPPCITDSYRDLGGQVAVRAAQPTLAAVPGTSNHGWGVALDLCGGIQQFGTPQHVWMQQNAVAYGWFHPAWAQQTGSKPEAWHWEFAG